MASFYHIFLLVGFWFTFSELKGFGLVTKLMFDILVWIYNGRQCILALDYVQGRENLVSRVKSGV